MNDELNFVVAETWLQNREKVEVGDKPIYGLMNEKFHATLEEACVDASRRNPFNAEVVLYRRLAIKTVVVDYDSTGPREVDLR